MLYSAETLELLRKSIAESELTRWATLIVFTLGFTLIARAILTFTLNQIRNLAYRLRGRKDDLLASVLERTWTLFLLISGVMIGLILINFGKRAEVVMTKVFQAALLIQIGVWGAAIIEGFQVRLRNGRTAASMTAIGLIKIALKSVLTVCVVLAALHTFGINITALVAGLGVSGIAVALAVQNILGDLFASLSIVLDRPFEVGDFIASGTEMGTIEKVGLKTTRVRSLTGEQLIFPNSNLLQSRLRNYQRMAERRVSVVLSVGYKTSIKHLKWIPDMIKTATIAEPRVRFERCHMTAFTDSGYQFETVYWVNDPDFQLHMDIQQRIFLTICEEFESHGIQFAHPPRDLYLRTEPKFVDAAEGFSPGLGRSARAPVSSHDQSAKTESPIS